MPLPILFPLILQSLFPAEAGQYRVGTCWMGVIVDPHICACSLDDFDPDLENGPSCGDIYSEVSADLEQVPFGHSTSFPLLPEFQQSLSRLTPSRIAPPDISGNF